MSQLTTNLGLVKPEKTDPADITATNNNWDKLDGMFKLDGEVPVLPIERGGTGSFTPYQALKNLGAAPSTYVDGLYRVDTLDEFNEQVNLLESNLRINGCGRYFISKESHENEFPSGDYFVEIVRSYIGFSTATAKGIHNGRDIILRRVLFEGNWGEWEWENPVLYYGVEYCTTEKWKGVPVYTKLLNKDSVTTGKNTIPTYTGGIVEIIKYTANLGGIPLPYLPDGLSANSGYFATAGVQDNEIYLNVGSELSGKNAEIQIWYTKQ